MPIDNNMENNPRWNGGRIQVKGGYIQIKMPTHPMSKKDGYILEHRLIMANHLKRILKPYEVVHHIDGNSSNNAISNLMLLNSQKEHINIERNGKHFPRKTGEWKTCIRCKRKFYVGTKMFQKTSKWCSWGCRYPKSKLHKKGVYFIIPFGLKP